LAQRPKKGYNWIWKANSNWGGGGIIYFCQGFLPCMMPSMDGWWDGWMDRSRDEKSFTKQNDHDVLYYM
jgi:hypothetical protein